MNLRSSRIYTAPVPKMPPGLVELMEGLAKDVLKHNPQNIYEFCSQHMQKLLTIRDGDQRKSCMTLEQKILRATEKVRQRAEQRQKKYDNEMAMIGINNENNNINKREINVENGFPASVIGVEKDDLHVNLSVQQEQAVESQEHDSLDQMEDGSSDVDIKEPENVLEDEAANKRSDSSSPPLKEDAEVTTNEKEIEKVDLTQQSTEYDVNQPFEVETMDNDDYSDKKINKTILEQGVVNDVNDILKSTRANVTAQTTHPKDDPTDCENKVDTGNNELENYSNNMNEAHIHSEQSELIDNENPISDGNVDIKTEITTIQSDEPFDGENTKCGTVEILPMTENDFNHKTEQKENDPILENSMDLEKAAITIQKVFRAFLFKTKTLSVDDLTNVDINLLIEDTDKESHDESNLEIVNKERRPLGITRMDTVLQTVNEEKSFSVSTEDSSTLSSAATIIQAHVRGFLVRNKMHFNKTTSTASVISDIQSINSFDGEDNNRKNKTILNIHIVPDGANFLSRDESVLTSVDLSLDGSPHSANLHPLGYDKNERRKQLKREDAIQSISPPSNNSGKLSEDIDSVKEVILDVSNNETNSIELPTIDDDGQNGEMESNTKGNNHVDISKDRFKKMSLMTSDEMDVVTPFTSNSNKETPLKNNQSKLMHSGEFHDVVLPTIVSRNNTSVVRGE